MFHQSSREVILAWSYRQENCTENVAHNLGIQKWKVIGTRHLSLSPRVILYFCFEYF